MKKIFKILAFIAMIITTIINLAGQASDKPSDWAQAEVFAAIDNGLVPEQLQKNYQNHITRYEYVLLALKVFDKTGKSVVVTDKTPFSDTKNHAYETEIIKAYNAGIVKGDGKGHFYPDKFITREEIASLIVNLLKQIAPAKDYTVKNKYTFADSNSIGDWAVYYIDYCYENKILNGYTGNRMDPKGNATIEQSIALLYRLANNEYLLNSIYGTIEIYDEIAGIKSVDPHIVTSFVENYSIETFTVLKQLSINQNIGIMSLNEKSATLTVNNNTITINNPDFEKNLIALVHNIHDDLFISAYKQLLSTFEGSEHGLDLFEEYVEKMKANEEIDIFTKVNDTHIFSVETLHDDSGKNSYMISYAQRK